MPNFSNRFLSIIQFIKTKDDFTSSQEIAQFLNVSTKTVLRTLTNEAKKKICLEYGFFIYAKPRFGYKLIVCDEELFGEFKNQFFSDRMIQSNDQTIRIYKIIQYLLNTEGYTFIYQLAEQFYVSESTLAADLKEVRKELEKKDLHLIGKPSKGIKIEGSELNIRLCLAENFFEKSMEISEIYTPENIEFVEKSVFHLLEKWKMTLSDLSLEHLISHILISIMRMENDYYITFDNDEKTAIEDLKEFQMSQELVECLSTKFQLKDQEEEIIYIAIQLLGKQSIDENDADYYTEEICEILEDIFTSIEKRLAIDLTSDETVFQYLFSHFGPMLARLKYGLTSINPLMEEVKITHQTSFEMGLIAKEVIFEKNNYVLDDNEVSYLAMYFSIALDRLKYLNSPKKILIVCGLGICSSRILSYKLRQRYGRYISEISTCEFSELRKISLDSFDCIISTVNKPIGTNKPVIYSPDFINNLNEKDLDAFFLNGIHPSFTIEKYITESTFFTEEGFSSKEEAIHFILKKISGRYKIPDGLEEAIFERERLSSTSFSNACALPHPIRMMTKETFCAVLVLKKAIEWGDKWVRYVFLLSPSYFHPEDLRIFNDHLAKILLDPEKWEIFAKDPQYITLKKLFSDF